MKPHRETPRERAEKLMRAVTAKSEKTDFMARAGIDMPQVAKDVRGSLPFMIRQELLRDAMGKMVTGFMSRGQPQVPLFVNGAPLPATLPRKDLAKMDVLVDMVMLFSVGEFGDKGERACSNYFDPDSKWYNVFYGAYGLRSHKPDGSAFGYTRDGKPNFAEFMEMPALDYNIFQAGQLGCPPEKMCFDIDWKPAVKSRFGQRPRRHPRTMMTGKDAGWDWVEVAVLIPSGLHVPPQRPDLFALREYAIYGVPDRKLCKGREPYEPVKMRGKMYMRRIDCDSPQPITLAFGVLCPSTSAGGALVKTIMGELWSAYKAIH